MGISNEPGKGGVGEDDFFLGLIKGLNGELPEEEQEKFNKECEESRLKYLKSKNIPQGCVEEIQNKTKESLHQKKSLYNIHLGQFQINGYYQDVYFDKVKSKIEKDKAKIILKFGVKKQEHYQICLSYNIKLQNGATGSLHTNIVDANSIIFSPIFRQIPHGWVQEYVKYTDIKPIILQILNNCKYNNNLELKSD